MANTTTNVGQATMPRLSANQYRHYDALQSAAGRTMGALCGQTLPNGADAYAAVWQPGAAADAVHRIQLDAAGVTAQGAACAQQGYQLASITGYALGGQPAYAAIWRPAAAPVLSWVGLSAVEHQQRSADAESRGYRPSWLNVCSVAGQVAYSAIWQKDDGVKWTMETALSPPQLHAKLNRLLFDGYRPKTISGYAAAGQRYAALWEQRPRTPWLVRLGLTADELESESAKWAARGFSVSSLTSNVVGGASSSVAAAGGQWMSSIVSGVQPLFDAVLTGPAQPTPAQQFLNDLMTQKGLATAWAKALAQASQLNAEGQSDNAAKLLDNFLADHGYDCDVDDVDAALSAMRAHDLSYWTGVYGTTTLSVPLSASPMPGPPLVVRGGAPGDVWIGEAVLQSFSYQNGTLSWPDMLGQTSGSVTFSEMTTFNATGGNPRITSMSFVGTYELPIFGSRPYVGFIGDMPANAALPAGQPSSALTAIKKTFVLLNRVIMLVQLARMVKKGLDYASDFMDQLVDETEVVEEEMTTFDATPDNLVAARDLASEASDLAAEDAGDVAAEVASEAAGEAAADLATEVAAEAAIDLAAAAAPEIAEGAAAAAAAAF